jgi:hypothetical protein
MNSKIQTLLERAAAQSSVSSGDTSSVANAARNFSDVAEAKKSFDRFKRKLFRVERWNADSGLSSFELFDENGARQAPEASAKRGDFIRITLTGSGKSDWVKITNIDEQRVDEIVLTIQPTYNPTEESADKTVTSHFFTEDSSNNFCLQKTNEAVKIYVIGLNEKSNTHDTNNIIETARNVATANLGHYLGIQKAEWTMFCENFLTSDN